jgi:hypothetical protein
MKNFTKDHFKLKFSVPGFVFLMGILSAGAQQNKPGNIFRLSSPLIGITFNNLDGLPMQYELLRLKEQFRGKEETESIKIVIRKASHKPPQNYSNNTIKTSNGEIYIPEETDKVITPRLKNVNILNDQADVCYEGYLDDIKTVSFTLRYKIKGETVYLTMEDVIEQTGYELIEIQTNSLVSVNQTDGTAWIAHGDGGGYYTDLINAKPCVLKDGWSKDFPYFPNFNYLPLVMIGNGKLNCSLEVQGYLCNTQLKVSDSIGQKKATMGVKSYYRVKGESITSLLVKQNEICRIDFTGDYDKNNEIDWLDAAKSVRDHMPPIPTHYFDDKMIWMVMGQSGRAQNVEITFTGIEKIIRKISLLTDGVPQVTYIAGWTEGGHDTGYPNITRLNEKMGGLTGFNKLTENARQYNAVISFDDNYDDQYDNEYTKGHYDEKYIARSADGSLMKQRAWNEVDTSHITGMSKYMQESGPGMERVRFTCQNYNLKHTELIDGLSWWSVRHDWDPIRPASAVQNLREGKFKLISEYKKYGVNIISELLRYPFVGKLALVVDGPDGGGWNGFGGTQIPLQRLVYSRSIIYGPGGGDGVARDPRLTLLHNCRRGPWISQTTADEDITDYYYLNFLPWTKLHALDILSFQRDNHSITMDLSNKSSVKIDYSIKDSFSAVYDGIQIMDGNSITCPIDNNRIAFYSKTEKTLTYPVPVAKNKELFKAKVLYEDRFENFLFKIDNGKIEITVPAGRPVIFSIE